VVAGLEAELRPFARLPQDLRVLLGLSLRGGRMRQVGERRQDALDLPFDLRELSFQRLDLVGQLVRGRDRFARLVPRPLGLRDLFRDLLLPGTPILDLRKELPPSRVEAQELVDALGRSPPGKRRLDGLGVAADQLEV
jgi:hypothetical protein